MTELGKMEYDNLIAGDTPTKTMEIVIKNPCEFKRGYVIGKTEDEDFKLVDSTATDGSENPIGIITDDIKVEDGETKTTTMYISGDFSRRRVVFGGTDTYENHESSMAKVGLILRRTIKGVN
jgi:hypothetical protein